MKYVAIKSRNKITIHLPHPSGEYDTLCGLDGDDPHPAVDQVAVDTPAGEKVSCLWCFQIWDVCRKFKRKDFISAI